MADQHYYQRTVRAPHAAPGDRQYLGLVVTGVALLMLAGLAWLFTRQQVVDSPLPQHVPAVSIAAQSAAAPVGRSDFTAPALAPVHRASAQAVPIHVVPVNTAPLVAKTDSVSDQAAPAMPASEDVAAVGDTRAVQP